MSDPSERVAGDALAAIDAFFGVIETIDDPLHRLLVLDSVSKGMSNLVMSSMVAATEELKAGNEHEPGLSWGEIGELFGISAQGAYKKLTPRERRRSVVRSRDQRAKTRQRLAELE